MNTPHSGGGDALCLVLFYVITLGLCHEAKNLEKQICDERAIRSLPFRVPNGGMPIKKNAISDGFLELMTGFEPVTSSLPITHY